MKPEKIIIAVLLITTALCAGCLSSGTLNVVIPPETRYNASAQVLIVMKRRDPVSIQDNLEHRLLKAGFVVKPNLSPDLAEKLRSEQGSRRGKFAAYTLEYDYHTRKTFFLKRLVFDKFSAKLIRVRDRKVLMDASFRGSRSVEGFLDELVDKMTVLLPQ
ncbi:MAG TPA: hypothetical protein PLT75_19580 [Spirochaetota bacterium]|nr:hypothetical protein [Spirochaetota bacterium]